MNGPFGRLVCCLVLAGPCVAASAAEDPPAPPPATAVAAAAPAGTDEAPLAASGAEAQAAPVLILDLPAPSDDASGTAAAVSDRPPGDGRRTLGAFPKNLGRGFVGVFSRDNLTPFLVGSALSLAGHAVDDRTATLLDGACVSCGRTGATVGGAAVVPFVGALFVAGRFAHGSSTFRAASYDAAQALIVNEAWTGILKYSLHRQRPDGSNYYSLPSGHTSTAFALATVAERHWGWKAGLPAYALAAGIGVSRIESNKHYLSDVIAGATLGTIVGRTVARVDGGRASRRTLAVAPATDAHGAGIGLGFSASW
jgi:membrane-associated phospholipid phosphatase